MWRHFAYLKHKKKIKKDAKNYFALRKSAAKSFGDMEGYKSLDNEEKEYIKNLLRRDAWMFEKSKKSKQENKRLTAQQNDQISRKIYKLAEERQKLEDRRDRNHEESKIDLFLSKEKKLKYVALEAVELAEMKKKDADTESVRRFKRMYKQEYKENLVKAKKATKEHDQAKKELEKIVKQLEKKNRSVIKKIDLLNQEIRELELKLENDYRVDRQLLDNNLVLGNSEIVKEINHIMRQLTKMEVSYKRFSHIAKQKDDLYKELQFKNRDIEGENERNNARRCRQALKWYERKSKVLDREEERYTASMATRSDSYSYSKAVSLRDRLSQLHMMLDEEIEQENQTRREKQQREEQERLTKGALERINSMLDGKF